jgi:hypothetical protein
MTGAGRAPTRRERTGRAIFLLSAFFLLFVAAFSYGYFVARTRSFPNRLISQAMTDVDAVVDLVRGNAHEIVSSRKQGGVTVHDAALAQPGLTFFTAFDGEVFQPFLVDIDGRVVHRWKTVYGVLFKGNEEFDLLWDSRRHMHGAHLYPDGSIVASFEYRGLVKLDRCSRTLWLLKRRTHHAILPQADGSFWTPSTDTYRERPHLPQGHREDSLLHVSTDGKVLEEINLIDAIIKGGYQAILMQGEPWRPDNDSLDPLHLNDVEIVTEALARRIPQAAPGDFLVSLAHPNALAIIGRESKSVVWSLSGPFLRQHDPDIVDDGTLLVFDNRTEHWQRTPVRWLEEPQVWGYSRILRIDPGTQQVLWSFAGSRTFPFYSSAMGKQQLLANGNILVSDPEGGRAFEIAPAHGNRVVWEYVNMLEGKDEGHLGRVTEATRYDSDGAQFLDKPCD